MDFIIKVKIFGMFMFCTILATCGAFISGLF